MAFNCQFTRERNAAEHLNFINSMQTSILFYCIVLQQCPHVIESSDVQVESGSVFSVIVNTANLPQIEADDGGFFCRLLLLNAADSADVTATVLSNSTVVCDSFKARNMCSTY